MHQNFNTVKTRAKISSEHLKSRLLIQFTLLVVHFFENNYIIKAKDNDFATELSFLKSVCMFQSHAAS